MNLSSLNPLSSLLAGSLAQNTTTQAAQRTSASQLSDLVTRVEAQSGETTTFNADGSSETTVKGSDGSDRIVSETGADGGTLTEVGYVSPRLLQNFLGSLASALDADGATATSATTATTKSDGTNASTAAMQTLITQLSPDAPTTAATATLLGSFATLVQGSGINVTQSTGQSTSQANEAALRAFLTNTLPKDPATNGTTAAFRQTA